MLAAVVAEDEADDALTITIDAARVAELEEQLGAAFGRPATAAELDTAVDLIVREEVLFREAMAMDLDAEDQVLRGRMVQKMEFLIRDVAVLAPATPEDLRAYHAEHAAAYSEPERLSFTLLYFNPGKRGDDAIADAEAALARLTGDAPPADPVAELGDGFLLGNEFLARPRPKLVQLFGAEFLEALDGLAVGAWQGPLASTYGVHLVRIDSREPGRPLSFDEAAERVAADFDAHRRAVADADAYAALLERYEVRVERP